MHLAHVNAQNLQKFMQGYAFHNAISSQTDWANLPYPCRLVYKGAQAPSLIVLPLLIPEYKDKIVAIELNGVYFCTIKSLDMLCFDNKIDSTLHEFAVSIFGEEAAKVRPLMLPTLNILRLQKKYSSALRSTIAIMQRHEISICALLIGRKWITVKGSEKPLVTCDDGDNFAHPYHDLCADLQPVLRARNDIDSFCAVNAFGMPNMGALRKCLSQLSK